MAIKKTKLKKSLKCKYCEKSFSTEKTLIAHMCVKKQRFKDKDTPGARLGFRAFQRFYELSVRSKTPKTELDFIKSQYYTSFVKFGRHLIALDPIASEEYLDFLIKNAIETASIIAKKSMDNSKVLAV